MRWLAGAMMLAMCSAASADSECWSTSDCGGTALARVLTFDWSHGPGNGSWEPAHRKPRPGWKNWYPGRDKPRTVYAPKPPAPAHTSGAQNPRFGQNSQVAPVQAPAVRVQPYVQGSDSLWEAYVRETNELAEPPSYDRWVGNRTLAQ